ncbi:MAG: hypothetical protein H6Q02_2698 [Acidobacteria bacterium]|nr:hypothetical protein [Acidobacteriota bacterium]
MREVRARARTAASSAPVSSQSTAARLESASRGSMRTSSSSSRRPSISTGAPVDSRSGRDTATTSAPSKSSTSPLQPADTQRAISSSTANPPLNWLAV